MSARRALYRFLVRRRVPISLISFTLILTIEGLLGVGWHHVNLRTDILFGVAVALVLIGVGVRSWAAGAIRKNSELATSGAYSLCRHPLYLGSFLMIVGFCLGTQPQINLPIVAPLVVVIYICSIRSEEVMLAQLFGDTWKSYSAMTPRLLPNLLQPKIRLTSWSIVQWRSNREYQAALGAIAGIGGMFAWYVFG
ncbi:MAG: isoprenylcysteine carboxylmethyltransferase family protein [Planctomycetota bacterium]|nr:isoprenylcysteine carboxylmethyltransferase family protein [Planctomycetota bacterium]